VPVIWATQVLESLVKREMPSRGEFTDAARAERAECVMLNEGPYIEEGIAVLDNVLRRTETHRIKRSAQLRPLGVGRGDLIIPGPAARSRRRRPRSAAPPYQDSVFASSLNKAAPVISGLPSLMPLSTDVSPMP
jgi:Pyruvate kinase, barrel domain